MLDEVAIDAALTATRIGSAAGAHLEGSYSAEYAYAFGLARVLDGLEALVQTSRGASIVINTSITHLRGQPFTSAYSASKAALRSLTRTAAGELASSRVRVNAVSPGPTDTPIHAKNGLGGVIGQVTARIPLGRLGDAKEIARAALFLASDESSFMTGEEIVVDGGMTSI